MIHKTWWDMYFTITITPKISDTNIDVTTNVSLLIIIIASSSSLNVYCWHGSDILAIVIYTIIQLSHISLWYLLHTGISFCSDERWICNERLLPLYEQRWYMGLDPNPKQYCIQCTKSATIFNCNGIYYWVSIKHKHIYRIQYSSWLALYCIDSLLYFYSNVILIIFDNLSFSNFY